ncbi:MAG: hypothetical protein JSR61_16680 [Proteobacteria bacterium]|nr:hypothetical protein [Pseudomonadota bacterium]MCW5692284.1 hypothetical protein [Pseudolabrys sp.]
MTKDLVHQAYEELLIIGCIKSRSAFSTDWLGMDESYYRSVMARGEKVSIRAQVHLAARLRDSGMAFGRAEHGFIVAKAHILVDLHCRLLEDLFDRVTSEAQGIVAE